MSKLRHAGSPVEQPVKLSRAKQDGILLEVIVDSRVVRRQMRQPIEGTIREELCEMRKRLRLDDPVLNDLIWRGAHQRPWISEVPA